MSRNTNMENNMQEVDATMNSEEKNNVKEDVTMMNNANKNNMKEDVVMMNNADKNSNAEAETMSNESIKNVNTDNTKIQEPGAPCDLAELIPADEQAVAEGPGNETKLTVVGTIDPLTDMITKIPEEEQAVNEVFPVGLMEAAKQGFFTPAVNMKGFITSTGHIIFAKLCIEGKKSKFIKYCQKYSNGKYSDTMEINTADFFMAAAYRFMVQTISEKFVKRNVARFLYETNRDYYNSLLYPQENIEVASILNLLLDEYGNLPVENKIFILEQPARLYGKTVQIIKEEHLNIVDEHDSYYTLWKEHMDVIADKLNIKTPQLLKKLREYHFLYLTESSEGYQTCVRFKPSGEFFPKTHTEWCYCILKLENLAKKREQRAEK